MGEELFKRAMTTQTQLYYMIWVPINKNYISVSLCTMYRLFSSLNSIYFLAIITEYIIRRGKDFMNLISFRNFLRLGNCLLFAS